MGLLPGSAEMVLDFALPIGVLIVLATWNGELFLAVLGAILTCMVLYIPAEEIILGKCFRPS